MYGPIGVEIVKELSELLAPKQSDCEEQDTQKTPGLFTRLVAKVQHGASINSNNTSDSHGDAQVATGRFASDVGCNG